jgi:flagellar protein FlaJ
LSLSFYAVGVVLDTGLVIFLYAWIYGVIIYAALLSAKNRAKKRKKKIDVNLAYAINFISAMASAGVTPTEIFKSLSKQDIYGEVKEESAWIYRDVGLLGFDILSAIKKNIAHLHNVQRVPSRDGRYRHLRWFFKNLFHA